MLKLWNSPFGIVQSCNESFSIQCTSDVLSFSHADWSGRSSEGDFEHHLQILKKISYLNRTKPLKRKKLSTVVCLENDRTLNIVDEECKILPAQWSIFRYSNSKHWTLRVRWPADAFTLIVASFSTVLPGYDIER